MKIGSELRLRKVKKRSAVVPMGWFPKLSSPGTSVAGGGAERADRRQHSGDDAEKDECAIHGNSFLMTTPEILPLPMTSVNHRASKIPRREAVR